MEHDRKGNAKNCTNDKKSKIVYSSNKIVLYWSHRYPISNELSYYLLCLSYNTVILPVSFLYVSQIAAGSFNEWQEQSHDHHIWIILLYIVYIHIHEEKTLYMHLSFDTLLAKQSD